MTVPKKRPDDNTGPSNANQPTNMEQFLKISNYEDTIRQLDKYYGLVKRQLLKFQSSVTGLFPVLSTDGVVAGIRDSLYCAAAVWALHQAYRRIDDDRGKSYELGQSTVKCMRGILACWMRQSSRIESFKRNQSNLYALHVKFHLNKGTELLAANTPPYNHLQIDVVSLYLLFLVQMIASGLQIIYTHDEVAFIQNLVYYVERAYRTPDFGMWERGTKHNDGTPELHASSIGMAKSALEAINGCNLFGEKGSSWSVIYVDIDAHNRNRSIFETLLPRESSSKDVDVALLPTVSFPAFATHEEYLYGDVKRNIVTYLKGKYGFRRHIRDGYKSVIEDVTRKYYEQAEMKDFENIECQWPLFFIFMIIDGVFKGLPEQISVYQELLKERIVLDQYGDPVIPMFYYVPEESLDEERLHPNSVVRKANGDPGLFLWNQAMFILAQLLTAGLLHINELDPIRRYLPSYNRPRKAGRYSAFQGTATDLVVQIVLIAESMRLQAMMATYGIQTQTPHEVEPVQIWSSSQLVKIYENLGVNNKLALQGRPSRPIGSLGTSKVYRICGATVLCYPLIFEVSDFYLYRDMELLIDDIKTELQFVGRYWRLSGRPTVCLLIREEHMRDPQFKKMLDLLAMLKKGYCDSVKVRTGRLQNLIASSCIEHLDFMATVDMPTDEAVVIGGQLKQLEHDYIGYQSLTDIPKTALSCDDENACDFGEFNNRSNEDIIQAISDNEGNLYGKCQLFGILLKRNGGEYRIHGQTVQQYLLNLYQEAGSLRHWTVVRYTSSLLSHNVDSISPFITAVLVHGKQITVGVIGQKETVFDKPMTPSEIRTVFYDTIQPYDVIQAVLQQEIILYCGRLISTHPDLFNGILKIRIGWVLEAIRVYLRIQNTRKNVENHSPFQVRQLLYKVLSLNDPVKAGSDSNEPLNPLQKRQIEGCLCRVPPTFYDQIWDILLKTPAGIRIGDGVLKQYPTISNMSKSELSFSLLVEEVLNGIQRSEYRQLIVELLSIVATILMRNPELKFTERLDLDGLIQDAANLFAKDSNCQGDSNSLDSFLQISRIQSSGYLARAVVNNVLKGCQLITDFENVGENCQIS